MRKIISALFVSSVVCIAAPSLAQTTLKIAASGAGSTSYAVATGIATVLSRSSGYSAALVPSAGQIENMRHLGSGAAQIGFAGADLLIEAQKGEGAFKEGKLPLQALLVLYPSRLHLFATE